MVDENRVQRLEAVAEAARAYRATMARYIAEQTRLLDGGLALEEVAERNWEEFAGTMRAEERLYDALEALDAQVDPPAGPDGTVFH